MRSKISRSLCIAGFCISLLLILLIAFNGFHEMSGIGIIGGADTPTFMLALRQTLLSAKGIVLSCIGVLSLLVLAVILIKGKQKQA